MRKQFPGTFQDFDFDIVKSKCVGKHMSSVFVTYSWKCACFSLVSKSPSPVRLCRRRPQKNTRLFFWSTYLVDFVFLLSISGPPKALCGCVEAACSASATSEKHTPWNVGACTLWILICFKRFQGPTNAKVSRGDHEQRVTLGLCAHCMCGLRSGKL